MSRSQPTQLPLFHEPVRRPAPRPPAPKDTLRLAELRARYRDLCFTTAANFSLRHRWSVGKPYWCTICGEPLVEEERGETMKRIGWKVGSM